MTKQRKRLNNAQFEKKRVIIGIDESYRRTGVSIAIDGKLKKVTSINFKNTPSKSGKRLALREFLKKAIEKCLTHVDPTDIAIIVERTRTFTQTTILSPSYMKATGALIAYIVDVGYEYGIDTWSVDTRAWKKAILGSSKPMCVPLEGVKDPQKIASVRHIIDLGFKEELSCYRKNKAFYCYNDDAADSACIALYGFVRNPLLQREL